MIHTAYAVVRNGRIESWPPGNEEELDRYIEQLEIYPTRDGAEAVKDLYVERTSEPYKVMKIRIEREV